MRIVIRSVNMDTGESSDSEPMTLDEARAELRRLRKKRIKGDAVVHAIVITKTEAVLGNDDVGEV